jgi:hypothetical protein
MIAAVWVLTAIACAGHIGLLWVPQTTLHGLILGHAPGWVTALLLAALLPQLVLIPWAWRHCGRVGLSRGQRALWRMAFFLTGFVAVALYALRYAANLRAFGLRH